MRPALLITGIFCCMLIAATAAASSNPVVNVDIPLLPHALYGNLTIQGVPGPAGSTVVALVSGGGGSLETTSTGSYGTAGAFGPKLLVQGNSTNGSNMSFTVNGAPAEARDVQSGGSWVQTYPFSSGAVTDLDLRIPGTPVKPVACFSGTPRAGALPLMVTFTDLSTGLPVSWMWNFGDGTPNSSARNPVHHYQQVGTFTVTLTASNAAGSDTRVIAGYITVNTTPVSPPVANFTGSPRAGDPPLIVSFTDQSTGNPVTWQWNFGDGRPNATGQNPVHVYQAAGMYEVTLTVSNAGGSDTRVKPGYIMVNEVPVRPPVADFMGSPRAGEIPLAVSFTDLTTGIPDTWAWNFGDGTPNATIRNPDHTYESTGVFTVTLTASNALGTDTAVKSGYIVSTILPLSAEFSADKTGGFVPLFVRFADLSTGIPTGWEWTFGDGTPNVTVENPSHLYDTAGTFTVTLTVRNATGNTSTITKPGYITVSSLPNPPVANFTANTTSGIAPLYVQFADTSTGDPFSWTWDFGDNSTSSGQNPLHKYRQPGNFTVSLTVVNTGGSDTEQKTGFIQVREEPPVAAFSANNTSGYAPLTVGFTDASTGGPTAWAWEFGDGGISSAQDPVYQFALAGNYTVNLTVSNSFGSNVSVRQDYITVLLPPAPVADFIAVPLTGYAPQLVQFTDLSPNNPTEWAWNFGDGKTSTEQNPSHTYYQGIFSVTLEVTNAGGYANITREKYINIYKSGGGGSGGGSGGGGYSYPAETTTTPTPVVTVTPTSGGLPLGPDNRTTQEVVIVSTDGNASLWINKGVKLTCNEEALRTLILSIVRPESMPPVPDADRYAITGYAYQVSPVCAVFDPNGLLSFTLTPGDWESLSSSELAIRWWDNATGTWISLPTAKDASTRSVNAPITRAGIYALFRTITPVTVPTTVPITTVPATTVIPEGGLPWNYLIPGIIILILALILIIYYQIWGRKPPGSPEPVYEEAFFEE
jgi:PKD repeat protein